MCLRVRVYQISQVLYKIYYLLWINPLRRVLLKSCGEKVGFGRKINVSNWENCEIGNHVFIGDGAFLMCANAPIKIANYVMFGPNVTMITGNHRIDIVGKYMTDITVDEKRKEDDEAIIVEDDVWVGANVTILKGVKIGEGSVVAAGAVVTKNVPPFSIVAGVPAKVIAMRFTPEQVQKHKKLLEKEV